MEINLEKRRSYFVHDGVEVIAGVTIDYVSLRETVLSLLKSHFQEDDIIKIGAALNISLTSKHSRGVKTSKGVLTLKDLAQLLKVEKASIDTPFNVITMARIAKCLAPECATFIRNAPDAFKRLAIKFHGNFDSEYGFPNAFLIVPDEYRDEWFMSLVEFEKNWVVDSSKKGKVGRFSDNVITFWSTAPKEFFLQ